MQRRHIRFVLFQAVLLIGLWLILSGVYDIFHISMGILSVLFVLLFNGSIRRVVLSPDDRQGEERVRVGKFLLFCAWLLWEIIVSSVQVAAIVLRPKLRIAPHLLRFRTRLPNLTAKIILGNSITLTPGTVTIEIKNDEFFVHVLTRATGASLVDGTMPKKVAKIFGNEQPEILYDMRHIESTSEL
jgi:multicomponent Na+:H+ antiporter subunit E